MASEFCNNLDPSSWAPGNLVGSWFCGLASAVGSVTEPATGTLGQLGDNVETVFLGGQEAVRDVATPGTVAALGAGVTFGGVLAVVGVGLAAVVVGDVVLTGGTGTRGALLWVAGGGRARSR